MHIQPDAISAVHLYWIPRCWCIRIWYMYVYGAETLLEILGALFSAKVEIHERRAHIWKVQSFYLAAASKWSTEITARRSFPTAQNLQLNSSRREKVNLRQLLAPSARALWRKQSPSKRSEKFRVHVQRALSLRKCVASKRRWGILNFWKRLCEQRWRFKRESNSDGGSHHFSQSLFPLPLCVWKYIPLAGNAIFPAVVISHENLRQRQREKKTVKVPPVTILKWHGFLSQGWNATQERSDSSTLRRNRITILVWSNFCSGTFGVSAQTLLNQRRLFLEHDWILNQRFVLQWEYHILFSGIGIVAFFSFLCGS